MKTLLLTLTYLVGAGEFILGLYFWVTNSKNEIRKVFSLVALSTGAWVISNNFSYINNYYIGILPYVFGTLMLIILLHFSIIYPHKQIVFDKLHVVLLYAPWFLISYLLIFTNSIILNVEYLNNVSITKPGQLFTIYNIYLSALFCITIIVFFIKSKKLQNKEKKDLLVASWSVLLGGIPGIIFSVLHYFQNIQYNYLVGPIFTSFWLFATVYILKSNAK